MGDWEPLENFSELSKLIVDIIAKKITLDDLQGRSDDKTLAKISAVQKRKKVVEQDKIEKDFAKDEEKPSDGFQEFKYSKEEANVKVDYEELEKKYSEGQSLSDDDEEEEEESELEKTRIVRVQKKPNPDATVVKTRIVNPPPPPKEEEPEELFTMGRESV